MPPPPSSTLFPYTTLFRSLLLQGTAPRSALLERFKNTEAAVLFATASFWQGVDVPGEQLSCVIVDRSEEHTSELQSRGHLVCRLLLEKKNKKKKQTIIAHL